MAFRVLIIGGTGQIGAAVVRALAAEPSCAEVVMVNRKAIPLTADPRLRQVIVDTAAAQFPAEVTTLAQSMVAKDAPVYGASCVGVGSGSAKWSEEALTALEIGVVGGFARGCHAGGLTQFALLSAAGSNAKKQDSLCAGHGVERRHGSTGRLLKPGDVPPGHHRQCPYAGLRCLAGAFDSWSIRDD